MNNEMTRIKANHWPRLLPILGTPGRRRLSTATGPSMYFCLTSGFSISFMSVQYGITY
jgi:hypothetical protein